VNKKLNKLRDIIGRGGEVSEIAKLYLDRGLFSEAQLKFFQLDGARRQVERWLKTRDETGLEMCAQVPPANENGEMLWQDRRLMDVTGYAWNYLLRDDLIAACTDRRERWRREGVYRYGGEDFNAEVERLRRERLRKAS
jgi:hypothetical protein